MACSCALQIKVSVHPLRSPLHNYCHIFSQSTPCPSCPWHIAPAFVFLSICFPCLAFHSSDTGSFGYFASSTFTVLFSPTFPSNTFSEFLTYQLILFSSPQTQASQLMSPLPESFPLLPWYIYSCSTTTAVQLLIRDFKIQRRGRQRKCKKKQ